jgi:hypothetical protein
MINAIYLLGGAGTQTCALAFGGSGAVSGTVVRCTEEYS